MKELKTTCELIDYMLKSKAPYALRSSAMEQIKGVEACNEGGASAVMLIAETRKDATEAERTYALSAFTPEVDEVIDTQDGASWKSRVFVLGDDGGGIVYYERVPLL